ncbi:MAG TPA: hypothetical protein VK796_02540, partial [Cytophaga sp.]|nr:hypothetical protein [Cytophaga sp.]
MSVKSFFVFGLLFFVGIYKSQNVNPFTGSFSYGQNVLHVPSNRGSGIDINVSYGAGIQMNQPASEIGLGWGIDAGGAIYRNVSGLPDDVKSYTTTNYSAGWSQTTKGQGALYPDTYTSSADLGDYYTTTRGLDSSEFVMPDFDNFSVTGPAFSGQMRINYHNFYSNQYSTIAFGYDHTFLSTGGTYRKPQFHFIGDFADTLISRHYPNTVTSATPFLVPTSTVTGNGYTTSTLPFIGLHLSGATYTNQNFDISTGRLATSNFVEYFRNGEIDTASSNSFTASTFSTFIDYKSSHARSSGAFPSVGIGYFRITASNGLTYHYSLPVYQLENTVYRVPLQNDYTLTGSLSASDYTASNVDPANSSIVIKDKTTNKFAIKWLLTAVTGADYVDSNNNHIVDDADQGYWVSYDYELWSSSFTQRSPHYGYDYQYSPDGYSQDFPQYFPFSPSGTNPYKVSGLWGISQVTKTEVYYLSKIRTSSHT